MPLNKSILLIGCGRMGSAMLTGWRRAGFHNITISDPAHAEHTHNISGAFDLLVLAVKPQEIETILPPLQNHLTPHTIILSIMAGVAVSRLKDLLNHDGIVIRAMPNTPALIGKGITALFAPPDFLADQKDLTEALLTPMGDLLWVDDENLMNVITAVSGSGPAYLFYLTEVLTNAGIKQGLPEDIAAQCARSTLIGAAYLMEESPDLSPAHLREQVTSKGGTTEAALKILMQNNGLQNLFNKAIEAASTRF